MDSNVIIGITNRHAVSPEEWRAHPSGQVPRRSLYRLLKSETLARLEEARNYQTPDQDDFIPGDLDRAIQQVEAGRPVDERILRSLYGQDLDAALIEAESDPTGDIALWKSEQTEIDLVPIILLTEVYTPANERPQDGGGPIVKSAETWLVSPSDLAEIEQRLQRGIAEGWSGLRDSDLARWGQRRIRKAALQAVVSAEEMLQMDEAHPEAFVDPRKPAFSNALMKSAREMNAALGVRGGDDLAQTDLDSTGREPASHVATEPHARVPKSEKALAMWKTFPIEERVERARQHPACTVFDIALIRAEALSDERASLLIEGGYEDQITAR